MKGFKDSKGKFHPIQQYKGVRKSRDQKAKTQGVRLAKLPLEGYLQKKGFSETGTHHHSTFLSPRGGFVGGGHKHKSHTDQLKPYLPKQKHYPYNPQGMTEKLTDEEEQLRKFTEDTGYVRVLNSTFLSQLRSRNDPHKLTFDINKKLTPQQLRSIKESEEEGNEISFLINRDKRGTGYRDLAREHAKAFGERMKRTTKGGREIKRWVGFSPSSSEAGEWWTEDKLSDLKWTIHEYDESIEEDTPARRSNRDGHYFYGEMEIFDTKKHPKLLEEMMTGSWDE